MASTMQLEFQQAMSDFKTMFPEMDRDVIEAVLRANQGAVDSTIDQLLAMSTDNQNEKLRNEMDSTVSPQRSLINLRDDDDDDNEDDDLLLIKPPPSMAAPLHSILLDTTDMGHAAPNTLLNLSGGGGHASPHHNTGASPKQRPLGHSKTHQQQQHHLVHNNQTPTKLLPAVRSTRRWNPPILGPLPPTFLRLQPAPGALETSGGGTGRDFELPDEQFALMLQNEEFMNELRWNQEFMTALEKEQYDKAKGEDDAAFKERLKHMGKVSRKKFLQMARVFTWQRNKKVNTAKQIDSLPLKEEPSDDEDHHHQQQQQKQQQRQQQPHQQLQQQQSHQSLRK